MTHAAHSSNIHQKNDANEVFVSGEVNRMIQIEVRGIYDRLEALRQQAKFPSFDTVNIPMVLVLGNHSSGKSTFINYMLGQEVQKTGRAPTDCTFTVLVGGNREERLDGSALARHAKFGFSDVQRRFGRELVSHIELKVVADSPLLTDGGLMLVDSPGMIDPPGIVTASSDTNVSGSTSTTTTTASRNSSSSDMDRGYDFKRVVQWLAERADVILVMFDPDKPGTTFETLDVLTSSLHGLSSKLLLILNKVDDFRTVHDFARAYGALCWNLSKVIPRKDLPFIYTMYVPQEQRDASASSTTATSTNGTSGASNNNAHADRTKPTVQMMLESEFDSIRGEVMREVERAPDRATDNLLNLLKATASRLKMHTTLLTACKREFTDLETFWTRVRIAGVLLGVGAVSLYVLRTAGQPQVHVITSEELADAANAAAALANSGSSSSCSDVAASATTTTTPAASNAAADKNAWKDQWAQQVVQAQPRQFSYVTLAKLLVSSVASNVALWRASLANLAHKRDDVAAWLPQTFARVYAPFLCKNDRIHDETLAQWHAVQPGLELAFSSTKLYEFAPFAPRDTTFLDDVLALHLPRLDRCVRDRTGDDYAYLRFKHLEKPSTRSKGDATGASS